MNFAEFLDFGRLGVGRPDSVQQSQGPFEARVHDGRNIETREQGKVQKVTLRKIFKDGRLEVGGYTKPDGTKPGVHELRWEALNLVWVEAGGNK